METIHPALLKNMVSEVAWTCEGHGLTPGTPSRSSSSGLFVGMGTAGARLAQQPVGGDQLNRDPWPSRAGNVYYYGVTEAGTESSKLCHFGVVDQGRAEGALWAPGEATQGLGCAWCPQGTDEEFFRLTYG